MSKALPKDYVWDPENPQPFAPHYKPKNVKLTNNLLLSLNHGTSTAADMTPAKWEAYLAARNGGGNGQD